MKKLVYCLALLATAGLAAHRVHAQAPEAPYIAPPPLPVAEPLPPLVVSSPCDHAPRRTCCQSPLGQFVNNVLAPVRLVSGGLVCDHCAAAPTPAEIARLSSCCGSPAEIAAAKIKADEAGAKNRRAAIRYLGTVDCHYYPEAECALVAGLRADRNECVRLEAAHALGNGCCCTPRTLEALAMVVNGGDQDGNPSETSPRVRSAAMAAMQKCLARGAALSLPSPAEVPARGTSPARGETVIQQAGLLQRRPAAPPATLSERLYAENVGVSTGVTPAVPTTTAQRSLFQLLANATASSRDVSEPPPPHTHASSLSSLSPIGAIPGAP